MKRIINTSIAVLVGALLAAPLIAAADDKGEVRNGGITTMLKNRDYELVMKPTVATVFIYQDEKPADTKGATGTITFTNGEKKTVLPLQPTGTNAMEAKGAFSPHGSVSATITLLGRKPQDVTWTLK